MEEEEEEVVVDVVSDGGMEGGKGRLLWCPCVLVEGLLGGKEEKEEGGQRIHLSARPRSPYTLFFPAYTWSSYLPTYLPILYLPTYLQTQV